MSRHLRRYFYGSSQRTKANGEYDNNDDITYHMSQSSSSEMQPYIPCRDERRNRQTFDSGYGHNNDEEIPMLILKSSSSEMQFTPRNNEKKYLGSTGRRTKENMNSNNKRSKRTFKATSTKHHDAPMQKKDIYFALDCEMVGVGPEGLDSALARISIINWDNEVVLDTYVKVQDKVTDYRTFVSGIRKEEIESDSALTLEDAQYAASNILRGKILIGHGLMNDLKVIGITHPWCDTRDTTTYQPFMQQSSVRKGQGLVLRPRKLRDLAWETLGKRIQMMGTAHSPIEDAITAMDLYKAVRANWEIGMMNQVHSAIGTINCQPKMERPPVMSRFRKATVEPMSGSYYHNTPHDSMPQMKSSVAMQDQNYVRKPQATGGTLWFPTTEYQLPTRRITQQ